ncbi:MAG: HypC/HybG/HupF family hydrogenase formation chaperone [Solirubrobacterales bacterium]|nr:HypC/HybG/HupF family hydrogenase formation chaperone [Solirubrobacterales bacterium]
MTAQACRVDDPHCITCGDEGVPMRVTAADAVTAVCRDAAGDTHEVAIDLVGPVGAGDHLLVHAGVAIATLEAAS